MVLCLGRTKFKNRWVVSWCRVCLDLVGRGGLSSMIIHAACPLLVPIRKCESHDVVGNSLLNRIKRLFQVTGMMLPSLRHRDNVLLPPPLLHTDPFLLDNILDVSVLCPSTLNQTFAPKRIHFFFARSPKWSDKSIRELNHQLNVLMIFSTYSLAF